MSSPIMTIMQEAARKASRHLLRDFGEVETLQVSRKGPADFVSRADKKAEEIIHGELSRARPGYSFLMEEAGEIQGTDKTHRFVIDPLDGTTNFLHGIPHFAISIGLERDEGDGLKGVAGVVYNPVTDEMFFAETGRGAFINDGTRGGGDRRLRPSQRDLFSNCVFATGVPFLGKPGHGKFLKELHQVMGTSAGIRRYGACSLDLAWTAAGRYDGFWERDLAPWDVSAGIIIAREAGLRVESLSPGEPEETGDIIMANERIFPMLKEKVS